MDEPDKDGARLLGSLRDFEPGPGGSVDPDQAVRTGRRRIRTRQAAGTAAVAFGMAAAIVSATLLGRAIQAPDERPAGPVLATFDPSKRAFNAGSAGGFTPAGYELGADRQRILFRPADPNGTLRGATAKADLYPAGRTPPTGTPAPDVNGARALWLGGAEFQVAWEWSPGAWGFVSVQGPGTDRERAHRVAQSIHRVQS